MTTRAEELAGEADARTHAVSLKRDRSADLQDAVEDSRTPAVWTRPVGERPAPQTPAAETKPKPATKAPAKSRLGGHSFGSDF
jgi:hypothetical protein